MPLGREVDIWECLPTSTVTTGIAAWVLSFEISALMDGGMEGHVLGTLCHQPHPLCADFILKLIKVMKNGSKYIR